MATNVFFNNYQSSGEQQLLESLIIESIKIFGQDMFYIPQQLVNFDKLYGADDSSRYEDAYLLEFYIRSFDGFMGDKDFISKIAGVQIQDQIKLSVARKSFELEVGQPEGFTRPREGDVIFFPLNQKCFQIKFVDKFEMFYPLGSLNTWELTCELYEYSSEVFDTGIEEIDIIQDRGSLNIYDYALTTEQGEMIMTEAGEILTNEKWKLEQIDPLVDTDTLQTAADAIIDWNAEDPFSEFGKV